MRSGPGFLLLCKEKGEFCPTMQNGGFCPKGILSGEYVLSSSVTFVITIHDDSIALKYKFLLILKKKCI